MLKYPINLKYSVNSFRNVHCWFPQQIQIRNRHDIKKNSTNLQSTFQNEVKRRQMEAKRSVFIETPGDTSSINELAACCSQVGTVRNIYRRDAQTITYCLVEYHNVSTVNQLIETAYHSGNFLIDGKIRTKSRFLTFNPTKTKIKGQQQKSQAIKRDTNITSDESILKAMREEKTIDNQIMKLYSINRLSDFSSRLRFLTALQIEDAVSGVFHDPRVLPFGSSINGFGRMQSDLDMILLSCGNRTRKGSFYAMELNKLGDGRSSVRNNLSVMSTFARHWLHGVRDVVPVLNARVPIIKYYQSLTDMECDLSMANFSGYQMSELLYTFGDMDERVRPFVFYIRAWAKSFNIIQTYPQQGLSSFMVTCLALFYLQQLPNPILPPADDFVEFRESDENIQNVTVPSKIIFKSKNTSTLSQLLVDFFEFYSSFNFQKDAISIGSGSKVANVDGDSMYVFNPLDHGSNVCRIVSDYGRNQFIEKCRISREELTSDKTDAVGLLEYFEKNSFGKKVDKFVHKMVNLKQHNKSTSETPKFNIKSLINKS